MQTIYEKDAAIRKDGGSVYALLEKAFYEYLCVERDDDNNTIQDNDIKIAMAIGKHGKFVYLYSPSDQKKWQREQKKKFQEE